MSPTATHSWVRRWRLVAGVRGRTRTEIIALVLTVACCAAVALEVAPAVADPDQLVGKQVPADDVQTIVSAALSCPTLNPPRLAAQIMAASGFDGQARQNAQGSSGVAGLDDKTWGRWKPWSSARRGDRRANIIALAHNTCEIVGRLRAGRTTGDLWPAAVAATRSGMEPVLAAKGVPADSRDYVDRVAGYAEYYSRQQQFRIGAARAAKQVADASQKLAVPEAYLADINAAGRICPTVTPARIAAQLRAASRFDPNRRSADGAQGIAQFSPQLWQQYRQSANASVWKPADAILALGVAMCDLANQFTGLTGADPYTLALGAFQWGPAAIRLANGLPRANVPQLSAAVEQYLPEYESDTRLTGRRTASQDPSATPTSPSAGTSASAAGPQRPYENGATYQILNSWSSAVIELRGDDTDKGSGSRIELWHLPSGDDHYWRFEDAPDRGFVVITNVYSGRSLGIENGSRDNSAALVQVTHDPADPDQQWSLQDAGGGEVRIQNRASGKVIDLPGDDLRAPNADNTWNGCRVQQDDLRPHTRDQRWRLIPWN